MSRDLGRDVPGSEKLSARKLCADFPRPKSGGRLYKPFRSSTYEKKKNSANPCEVQRDA